MALGDCGSCLAWHNLSQQGTARPGCCKEAYEPPRGCLSRQEACSCASFSWLPRPHSLRCSFSGWGGPASPPPCLPPPHLRGSGCKDVPSRGPWGQAEGLSEPSLLLGRYLGKEGKAIGVAEHCHASPCPLTGLSMRSSPAAGRCGGHRGGSGDTDKMGCPILPAACPPPPWGPFPPPSHGTEPVHPFHTGMQRSVHFFFPQPWQGNPKTVWGAHSAQLLERSKGPSAPIPTLVMPPLGTPSSHRDSLRCQQGCCAPPGRCWARRYPTPWGALCHPLCPSCQWGRVSPPGTSGSSPATGEEHPHGSSGARGAGVERGRPQDSPSSGGTAASPMSCLPTSAAPLL